MSVKISVEWREKPTKYDFIQRIKPIDGTSLFLLKRRDIRQINQLNDWNLIATIVFILLNNIYIVS